MLVALAVLSVAGCGGRDGAAVGEPQRTLDPQATPRPTANAVLAEARSNFTVSGKPIHPALVYEFMPWLPDNEPITVAVDLLAARRSGEYSELAVAVREGWIECEVTSFRPVTEDVRMFGYKRWGVLSDGTQVLYTYYSSGGTGAFCYLMFVRLETENTSDLHTKLRARLIMKVIGIYSLGDRDDGTVQVLPDRVIVGPSKYRDKEVVLKLD
jgi:hypothetical protein